jgi:hypothetical protein
VIFRLTYAITGYRVASQENARIEIGGPHDVRVVLRHEADDPRSPGNPVVLLESWAEFDAPPRAARALRELAIGQLPDGSNPDKDLAHVVKDGRIPLDSRVLDISELPGALQQFSDRLYLDLSETATTTFELIRWRHAIPGPPRPYSSLGLEWSEDGEAWHRFPTRWIVRVGPVRHLRPLSPEDGVTIGTLVSSGEREPLAHVLLREAQSALPGNNASALVMGMAALEIGVKQLIGSLVPEANWLATELPSPPIVRILREYVPTLPVRQLFEGEARPPPDDVLDMLKNAVSARNDIAHAGAASPRPDFVERVLSAVSDVLWMCDYYAGNAWAQMNLSDDTRTALRTHPSS